MQQTAFDWQVLTSLTQEMERDAWLALAAHAHTSFIPHLGDKVRPAARAAAASCGGAHRLPPCLPLHAQVVYFGAGHSAALRADPRLGVGGDAPLSSVLLCRVAEVSLLSGAGFPVAQVLLRPLDASAADTALEDLAGRGGGGGGAALEDAEMEGDGELDGSWLRSRRGSLRARRESGRGAASVSALTVVIPLVPEVRCAALRCAALRAAAC